MKKRRIRTLSSLASTPRLHVAPNEATQKSHTPTMQQKQPNKPIEVDTEKEVDSVFKIEELTYDQKDLVKSFEDYASQFRVLVLDQVIRHQAMRSAIIQVKQITTQEFNNSFVELDGELDDSLGDLFKMTFFTSVIEHLNKEVLTENPMEPMEVIRLLFFPNEKSPVPEKKLDIKKLTSALASIVKSNVGPYGVTTDGDKSKS